MRFLFTIFFFVLMTTLIAQDYPRQETDFSRLTDELLSFPDDDINYEDVYENFVQLFSNPMDINTATKEELRLLNILSEIQIDNLHEHIRIHGKLISVYELQSIGGFDLPTIYKVIPFVTVSSADAAGKPFITRVLSNQNTYLVTRYERRLQTSAGYDDAESPDGKFQGSPDKYYVRFRSSKPGDFSFGLTGEKDAGEKFAWSPASKKFGLDYLSYHAQILNKGKIKNLIIGDYQCQFGQGLVLGNAFGLGKGGETINTIRKTQAGLLPYTSVNEAGYLRGAAASLQLHRRSTLSVFYSATARDASVGEGESPSFSSISVTGLHRNLKELTQRKRVAESVYGGVFQYVNKLFEVGAAYQAIHFSVPVLKDARPYNQFAFQGQSNVNASVFFNYTVRNFNFFGEGAKSWDGGYGLVTGMLTSLDARLDMAMLYRHYQRDYYSFYGNGFGENTIPQNESGMYWGWKYRVNRRITASAYVDLFRFPWLKFRTYNPSAGHEYLARIDYVPSKKVKMFLQFRQELKDQNSGSETVGYETRTGIRKQLWTNFDYALHPNIKMKTRAQFSSLAFDDLRTKGMTILQDLTLNWRRFGITGRYALFDTDDFNNRQYAYENDVWLAYSLPAYSGTGIRKYVMIDFKVNKHITIWLRYSLTNDYSRTEFGGGVDQIDGNKINDVKFQLRITP